MIKTLKNAMSELESREGLTPEVRVIARDIMDTKRLRIRTLKDEIQQTKIAIRDAVAKEEIVRLRKKLAGLKKELKKIGPRTSPPNKISPESPSVSKPNNITKADPKIERTRHVVEEDDDEEERDRGGRKQVFVTGDELSEVLKEVWGTLLSRGDNDLADELLTIIDQ